jgi:hypothetical protein
VVLAHVIIQWLGYDFLNGHLRTRFAHLVLRVFTKIAHHPRHYIYFPRNSQEPKSSADTAPNVILLIQSTFPLSAELTLQEHLPAWNKRPTKMSFATPQRPLPGTFFNTPAANRYQPLRQPVFGAPSQPAQAPTNPRSPQSAAPVLQLSEPVQRAARTINEVFQREASFPDLDSYVRRKHKTTKATLKRVLTK